MKQQKKIKIKTKYINIEMRKREKEKPHLRALLLEQLQFQCLWGCGVC